MQRSVFLALVGITLGTACTPEEQCKQIALGSSSAGLGTFGTCYFMNFDDNGDVTGCFDAGGPILVDTVPGGVDAGPNPICLGMVTGASDDVGRATEECMAGPEDSNGNACIIWESGDKVVGHEWAHFYEDD